MSVLRLLTKDATVSASLVNGVTAITTLLGGIVIMKSDGSYGYTAPANLDHSNSDILQDSFTYKASDSTSESDWTPLSTIVFDVSPEL